VKEFLGKKRMKGAVEEPRKGKGVMREGGAGAAK
jgi:hypothetical protein